MGQPFRLLVTGSRTWHDIAAIEQVLAVILDRHPEGVLLVHGACPRGADAIAAACAARTPATRSRRTLRLAPVRASCRVPPQRRDDRPGRGWVRRVHPWRQSWQHWCGSAGQRSRHPRLALHTALIDRAELTATVTATAAANG
jgi:hypothetical protein